MEEIKVGEYVRTEYGEIFKVIHLTKQKEKYVIVDRYVDRNEDRAENDNVLNISDIVKHSPNIKDLIEVGDIIIDNFTNQPIKVSKIDNEYIWGECNLFKTSHNTIKSIVTKQQFESIKYEV